MKRICHLLLHPLGEKVPGVLGFDTFDHPVPNDCNTDDKLSGKSSNRMLLRFTRLVCAEQLWTKSFSRI